MRWIRVDQRLIGLACGQLQVFKNVHRVWVCSRRGGKFHYLLVTKTWGGFIGKEGSINWLIHARVDCYSLSVAWNSMPHEYWPKNKVRITITVPHGEQQPVAMKRGTFVISQWSKQQHTTAVVFILFFQSCQRHSILMWVLKHTWLSWSNILI